MKNARRLWTQQPNAGLMASF